MDSCQAEVDKRAQDEFDNFEEVGIEVGEEDEESEEITSEVVTKEAIALATDWIIKFFAGREMHYGGPIPANVITNDKNVNILLNVDISTAAIITYAAMEVNNGFPYPVAMGGISDDVRWVIAFIKNCAAKNVPDCFVGGLMLIYLEVCEGIKIPQVLVKEIDVRCKR